MRTRLLVIVGILVGSVTVPLALQGSSLPQKAVAASTSMYFHYLQYKYSNITPYLVYELPANNEPTSTIKKPSLVATTTPSSPSIPTLSPNPNPTPTPTPNPRVQPLLPVVDHDDIKLKHRRIADEVLRSMPIQCRDALKHFYVRYDNPEHRGLGGKTTIILSGQVPDDEFRALMIHELGHIFDLNGKLECLGGSPESGKSSFVDGNDLIYKDDPSILFYSLSWSDSKTLRSDATPSDFVTGYAMWDAFEDFAESFAFFVLHNETFRHRAKTNEVLAAKYRWFEHYLFPDGIHIATSKSPYNGSIPWDATKLSYDWHPGVTVAHYAAPMPAFQ